MQEFVSDLSCNIFVLPWIFVTMHAAKFKVLPWPAGTSHVYRMHMEEESKKNEIITYKKQV